MKSKKHSRLLALTLALTLVAGMALPVQAKTAKQAEDLTGKLVILHSNDTHGRDSAKADQSLGTAAVSWLKADLTAKGADVLLFSAGDVIQGKPLVNITKGQTAIEFMNSAHYNLMVPGNHEFDYGFKNLKNLQSQAEFPFLAANILDKETGKPVFPANVIINTAHGYTVGVFGLDTPETQTKSHPKNVEGLTFLSGKDLYKCAQEQIDYLKGQGCNLIVCVGHLGTDESSAPDRSYDVIQNTTGINLFIDGHSHTEIKGGEKVNDTLLVSTGEYLNNIGQIVFDGTNLTADLISAKDYEGGYDEQIAVATANYDIIIDNEYGKVFGKTLVNLNGTRAGGDAVDADGNVVASFLEGEGNRTCETNLGDFATDAILTIARRESGRTVDAAITNGGGIRETIPAGDITKNDMITVFPFGNEITLVTVTGSELLEALEAACSTCPEPLGAFPQVSGITFTIDAGMPYVKGAQYPDSTYFAPAAPGARVKDVKVNGEPLSLTKEYTIATNDFTAAGGDTYYAFKRANLTNSVSTGISLEDALIEYITEDLNGVIGEDYAAPKGRIDVNYDSLVMPLEPAA